VGLETCPEGSEKSQSQRTSEYGNFRLRYAIPAATVTRVPKHHVVHSFHTLFFLKVTVAFSYDLEERSSGSKDALYEIC
jgi:hypothetical protein